MANIDSINKFEFNVLDFIRPTKNSLFIIHDINAVKLPTRTRLNLSHLNENKFRHDFHDMIDP